MKISGFVIFGTFLQCLQEIVIATDSSIISATRLLGIADRFISQHMDDKIDKPIVTISYAQTIDGSMFQLLHSLRACHDGVLIGINTLICDDPQLNVRDPLPNIPMQLVQPRPIVIDSKLKIASIQSRMRLKSPIFCTCVSPHSDLWMKAQSVISEYGGQLVHCQHTTNGRCDLVDAFSILKREFGLRSILVEGGAQIIQSSLEQGLVDQILVTLRTCFFGGYRSLTRQLARPYFLCDSSLAIVGGDVIIRGCVSYGTDEDCKGKVQPAAGENQQSQEILIHRPQTSIQFIDIDSSTIYD